jgi:hypothetical protein
LGVVAARKAFEHALNRAPHTRWEKNDSGRYAVRAPVHVHRKLDRLHERLLRHAPDDRDADKWVEKHRDRAPRREGDGGRKREGDRD